MQFDIGATVGRDEAVALYEAVGWTAYTRDADALARAIAQSHLVVTARDGPLDFYRAAGLVPFDEHGVVGYARP